MQNINTTSEFDKSLGDINLIAELDHLVTERQTRGIYRRKTASIITPTAEALNSPEWMHMQTNPLGTDETWEDFMNMGFEFDNEQAKIGA